MTREKAKELLPIIQAYADGEEIQYRGEDSTPWRDCIYPPAFADVDEYRIKPKLREYWLLISENVAINVFDYEPSYSDAFECIHVKECDDKE